MQDCSEQIEPQPDGVGRLLRDSTVVEIEEDDDDSSDEDAEAAAAMVLDEDDEEEDDAFDDGAESEDSLDPAPSVALPASHGGETTVPLHIGAMPDPRVSFEDLLRSAALFEQGSPAFP